MKPFNTPPATRSGRMNEPRKAASEFFNVSLI
jgi:hypothetical protein